jgi:TonB family protein
VLVRLTLRVGTDGVVKQVRVVRGAGPAFDREARAGGMRARFEPAPVDGEPVESWVPWGVEFTPDDF